MFNDRIECIKLETECEKQEYMLFSLLKPSVYIDGNKWCVLYGKNIQDGVAGFGDSPYLAVIDFNKSWGKQLTTSTEV